MDSLLAIYPFTVELYSTDGKSAFTRLALQAQWSGSNPPETAGEFLVSDNEGQAVECQRVAVSLLKLDLTALVNVVLINSSRTPYIIQQHRGMTTLN